MQLIGAAKVKQPILYVANFAKFFENFLDTSRDKCWIWPLRKDAEGYGVVKLDGVKYRAHRVAFALANAEDPGTWRIYQICDNRACCNPGHLQKGNQADVNAKRDAKGNGPLGARNGRFIDGRSATLLTAERKRGSETRAGRAKCATWEQELAMHVGEMSDLRQMRRKR